MWPSAAKRDPKGDTLLSPNQETQEEIRVTLTSTLRVSAAVVALCVALGSGGFATLTSAQTDLASESLRQVIEQSTGKRVKLKLVSGQDLEGSVAKVSNHAVSLTELTGAEFFDATIRL